MVLALAACGNAPSSLTDAGGLIDAGESLDAALSIDGSPDFSVDLGRASIDLSVGVETFGSDSCELAASEQCVGAAGARRVLRFSVETLNLGNADLTIGPPGENPNYEFSECHGHFHFRGYANYRLLGPDGAEVLAGRKQAFCLLDSEPYTDFADDERRYSCLFQGLSAGWADVYPADLPCQFLDITDVPNGEYILEVAVNPEGLLADSNTENNTRSIAVQIGSEELAMPTEACPEVGPRYLRHIQRECGWDFLGTFPCVPGTQTGAGCAQNCGVGSCSGDPMLRVCDAAEANCTTGIALRSNDNRCGGACPMATEFLCPESGQLAVYAAPTTYGAAYECTVSIAPGPPSP